MGFNYCHTCERIWEAAPDGNKFCPECGDEMGEAKPKPELTYADLIREHKITAIAVLAVELAQTAIYSGCHPEDLVGAAACVRDKAEMVVEAGQNES